MLDVQYQKYMSVVSLGTLPTKILNMRSQSDYTARGENSFNSL